MAGYEEIRNKHKGIEKMIPLSKYLMVSAIASLYHGEVPKPRRDDYQLVVNFTNGDDKQNFIKAFNQVKVDSGDHDVSMDRLVIVNNDHGLQATIDVNTIWT